MNKTYTNPLCLKISLKENVFSIRFTLGKLDILEDRDVTILQRVNPITLG